MYLDYTFYINNGGSVTEETAFNVLNRQSQAKLNHYTVGNLKNELVIGDDVKYCLIDMINYVDTENKKSYEIDGVAVKSVSNNGVSMSMDNKKDNNTINTELLDIINAHLSNYFTEDGYNVLYRGVKS